MKSIDLGLVGNGSIGALIDERGEIVWCCFPRFDGDPLFCSLLKTTDDGKDFGYFSIELADFTRTEQHYKKNTALLATRLLDHQGRCRENADDARRNK